ncbi:3-dehydroquinate synthase [Psychroserpens sp.]|uniref:3-dehydroquinate synthase n=1 Tax=Psychroserpens sp. TaxID=2020870 RepID=UPI001AFD92D0|nr:3-dehydroquinate synthase [Psychroserpens sp.]MBO6606495.1 3-dehydroquinate synthase [Psychroserpens sp.]MBO6630407.1 3-dehydroquinate synthase [Psychroserpens sp.]MBO6653199.1 3-dehydroquinate synthase [Psychroserpens sp.]MBO6680773.1 3-dehydroquinate synthase [Psychroserpens sp.]MBO6750269.1 3-dehydroquinate synthase [Psychroserpens sp.]
MTSIITETYKVHFNDIAYNELNTYVKDNNFSKVFILVDSNTHEYCLSKFMSHLTFDNAIEVIEIDAGEHHKSIDTCVGVWNVLSELGADRKSLMLNLGGGVVTDLGGFVACTFKRGIEYINIPTSLLAMVDASVGGKTGVDLGTLKNQVGVISSGAMVLVDTSYLETLPKDHLRSGLAEMLKHGLITNRNYFDSLTDLSALTLNDLDKLIYDSVVIKKDIVTEDPNELSVRKHLNFGHTLGHAIESYFLSHQEKPDLLHGEAIAVGMILECYLSSKLLNFPNSDLEYITQVIHSIYDHITIESTDHDAIIDLLKYDKKNSHGKVNFVLLEQIGQPKINCSVPNELIIDSFNYYSASSSS